MRAYCPLWRGGLLSCSPRSHHRLRGQLCRGHRAVCHGQVLGQLKRPDEPQAAHFRLLRAKRPQDVTLPVFDRLCRARVPG